MSANGANGQALLESVVYAHFRPDRNGRWLVEGEPLPAECPIEDASDEARSVWAQLVAEQERARRVGVTNAWRFSSLVRRLHAVLATDVATSDAERHHVAGILRVGPLELHSDADDITPHNAHAVPYTVEVLTRHWREWAHEQEWRPSTWAYQHFVAGLEPAAALEAAERERQAEHDLWIIARLRTQGSIGVDDPLLRGHPLERRRELLELAGL